MSEFDNKLLKDSLLMEIISVLDNTYNTTFYNSLLRLPKNKIRSFPSEVNFAKFLHDNFPIENLIDLETFINPSYTKKDGTQQTPDFEVLSNGQSFICEVFYPDNFEINKKKIDEMKSFNDFCSQKNMVTWIQDFDTYLIRKIKEKSYKYSFFLRKFQV